MFRRHVRYSRVVDEALMPYTALGIISSVGCSRSRFLVQLIFLDLFQLPMP
jgi:hypothetical protein